jgi:DNA-binding transcriptional regulator/RsmH inhibitor MraZ
VKETVRIDKQRRFYVTRRLLQACDLKVPAGKTVSFWVAVGDSGQLQLLSPDSKLSKLRDEFDENSRQFADESAGGDDETQAYRRIQSFLRATCHARTPGGKVSITFNGDATKDGYLNVPSNVVVVTTGKIFEVWSTENWRQSSRITDLRQFAEEADEFLAQGH